MTLVGILTGLASVAGIGVLLFGCAGRWDIPWFWAYLGVLAAPALVLPPVLDPGLIAERLRPGPGGHGHLVGGLFLLLGAVQHAVAGLDVGRWHWSDTVPPAVRLVALVVIGAAFAVTGWAMMVNRFFSSVIRLQPDRGHRLVRTGPYAWVRHPAYAVAPFLVVASGLALGSWLATLVGILLVPLIVWRTADEDRFLRAGLEGYAGYAAVVRYRLLPGVW